MTQEEAFKKVTELVYPKPNADLEKLVEENSWLGEVIEQIRFRVMEFLQSRQSDKEERC